ncbi:MAG: Swt1 family HEPN domain-containing protein [Pseudomonadota bacterium]
MTIAEVYEFVFRGLLTEEALDREGRVSTRNERIEFSRIRSLLGIDVIDDDHVTSADKMSQVYVAIAAFENSVRELVSDVMRDNFGDDWWEQKIKPEIRNDAKQRMENEEKVRWHVQRGGEPLNYTMIGQLLKIILHNFEVFEPFVHDPDWTKNIFDTIEKSRNVIMHSGTLSDRDMARIGSFIKDWNAQVSL